VANVPSTVPQSAADNIASIPPVNPELTPAPPTETAPAGVATENAPAAPPSDAVAAAGPPAETAGAADPAAPPSPEPIVPVGPVEVGTYLGDSTVLLHFDAKVREWRRLEERMGVFSDEEIVALPEFRPVVTLHSGFYLDLIGPTRIVPGVIRPEGGAQPAEEGMPSLDVAYGKLVLFNPSNGDRSLHLVMGPNTGDVRLAPKAKLAVEVERMYVPGNDPMKTPAPVAARLYAPGGGVEWTDANGSKTMDASSRLIFSNAGAEVAAEPSIPNWIDENLVQIDRRSERRLGAPFIEPKLVSNLDVSRQLAELLQSSRRKEVTSVLAKSGIHVGLFEPLVDGLHDDSQRPYWSSHIQALRMAMAISPEWAAGVRKTLEAKHPESANELYEMLCGYSAQQIGQTPEEFSVGAVSQLIDRLEEDNLEYRVLAVENLKEITGKELMNPGASASERAKSIKIWRRRLKDEGMDLLPKSRA
jgi:hypothetical protein